MPSKIAYTLMVLIFFSVSACNGQIPAPFLSKTTPAPAEKPLLPGSEEPDNPAVDQTPHLLDTPMNTIDSGTPLAEQPVAGQPTSEGIKLQRAGATIESAELLQKESFPKQITLELSGVLPTPCHQVKAEVHKLDAQNRIEIDVYSLVDPAAICAQVLAPFELRIQLGSYPAGKYTVVINDEERGRFEVP
ncbi:MAG: hypothetical protein HPY59_09355 [Anaerolineae bacterium]|nr:hypothetical protein [Anaerolineae bacterium]